jgi:hypothetical protein
VPVRALEGFYELLRGRVPIESLKPSWLIYGDGFRQNWWRALEKRLIDVVASLVLLAVFLPVMVLAAIAIVLESGFPIRYRQERVGRGGRTLVIWKFRSMRQDAGGRRRRAGPRRTTRGALGWDGSSASCGSTSCRSSPTSSSAT